METRHTFRDSRPINPGNLAKSATLEAYPAWSFGLKRHPDPRSAGPGPAFPANCGDPWDRKSFKFGPSEKVRDYADKNAGEGPFYNYSNNTISGEKLTGGWRAPHERGPRITPGPHEYNTITGFEATHKGKGKPFLTVPSWGLPPPVIQHEKKRSTSAMPSSGRTSRTLTPLQLQDQPMSISNRFGIPQKVTPGPGEYDTTVMYKYGDKYHGATMGQRFKDKKPDGFPSPAHYTVHQTTLGAATRRGFTEKW